MDTNQNTAAIYVRRSAADEWDADARQQDRFGASTQAGRSP